MIVGTAIGLHYLSQLSVNIPSKSVISTTFVVIMICFFVLSAQSSSAAIQTYSIEEETAGDWIDSNATSPMISDMRVASLPSSKEPTGYYPRSESSLYKIFYSENETLLLDTINEMPGDYFLASEKMRDIGVYIPPNSRQPVSTSQYNLWEQSMSSVYDNGESTVLKIQN
jgi:hypothetical protein